jgi:hypothetical protein
LIDEILVACKPDASAVIPGANPTSAPAFIDAPHRAVSIVPGS